ncbi:archease [Nocardia xishanensis]
MTPLGAGHRFVPHTADLRIEAWAATRERCLAEAVAAMIDSLLDHPLPPPEFSVEWDLSGDRGEDQLVELLEEVIYRMEVSGCVPVATDITATSSGTHVRFDMAEIQDAEPCGAVPKAVSLHRIRLAPDSSGWRCAVTIDV